MKYILLLIIVALYILELMILMPIFLLLLLITGKDLSKSWMTNWFDNYINK